MAELYLGVDGGQSRTKAVVGDAEGRILGRGVAGPCNHVGAAEGRAKLTAALTEAVNQALGGLGLTVAGARFEAACFGMSGGPADKARIIAELVRAERIDVTTDAAIALLGGAAGEPGLVVIAGTGSMAYGRNAEGRAARAGGWGYVFGDEGGAFDIVRQALRAALRHEEGWGEATALTALLLAESGAADVNDLLHRFYTEAYPRPKVAGYSRVVDRAAGEGDIAALEILRKAGEKLARYGLAVRRNLFSVDRVVPVVRVGGVFESGFVRDSFVGCLSESGGCEPCAPMFDPEVGALIGAYRLAGLEVVPDGF
jgi:N-acetylglucosamine kinase-like BadF-type ATPase